MADAPEPKRRTRPRRPVAAEGAPKPAAPRRRAVPRPKATPEVAEATARSVPELRESAAPTLYERAWKTGLPSVGAIARRELGAYFVSPVGYIIAAILAVLVAWSGYLPLLSTQQPVGMDQIYYWTIFWMMIGVPVITMRLVAEERRMGTLELLLTSPVRDWEVVVGKWLGALVFFLAITAFVFVMAGLLVYYQPTHQMVTVVGIPVSVGNLDLGPILTGYLGLVLTGGAFLAIGLLCSSLTSNQLVAAFASIAALAVFFFLLEFFVGRPPYGEIAAYLSAYSHWTSFSQGRLVLQDVVYFATAIIAPLFLATRVLESRRWR